MKCGDIVSIRSEGRQHLARIDFVTERSAHVEFIRTVPVIDGHRRKKISVLLSKMRPHGVAGVAYKVDGVGTRRGDS